jgi:hypothetical protein
MKYVFYVLLAIITGCTPSKPNGRQVEWHDLGRGVRCRSAEIENARCIICHGFAMGMQCNFKEV